MAIKAVLFVIFLLLAVGLGIIGYTFYQQRRYNQVATTAELQYENDNPDVDVWQLARGEVVSYNSFTKILKIAVDDQMRDFFPFPELSFELEDIQEITCWAETDPASGVALRETYFPFSHQRKFQLAIDDVRSVAEAWRELTADRYVFVLYSRPEAYKNDEPISKVQQVTVIGCKE